MPDFETINPATGEVLAQLRIDEAPEVDAAVVRAAAAQREWGALTGIERGRILRRAVDLLRASNDDLARLETLDTGKPIQETAAVDIVSGVIASSISPGSPRRWRANISTLALRRSAMPGANRWVSPPGSAHGIIRSRSRAGNRPLPSRAAMR